MRFSHVRMVLGVVLLAQMATLAIAAGDEDPRLTKGREYLKLMTDNKYDEFCAQGDEMMKSGFSPTRARLTWEKLTSQLGRFAVDESATMTTQGENAIIAFVWRFERGVAKGRLHLDKGDRISGFWFDRMEVMIPGPDYADGSKFKEEPITVTAGAMSLNGKICVPTGPGPHPAVVLVHAYGSHDMEESVGATQVFRDLAWGLASNGVAVLRYEKRNRAFPAALKPEDWTMELEYLEDARAATQMLRERADVDPARVFVLGYGMGATAAAYMAKDDRKIAGLVLLAAPGRLPVDQIEDEAAYLADLDGKVDENEVAQAKTIGDACQRIRNDDAASVPGLVAAQPAKYWVEMCRYNGPQTAEKLELPMFVAHGGRDYKVNKKDAEVWRKLAESHKNIKWRGYEGLNFQLVKGAGRSTPDDLKLTRNVDEEIVKDVAKWIGEQGKKNP